MKNKRIFFVWWFFLFVLAGGRPAHATSVGEVTGEFSVNEVGAAVYRVPIEIAPGVGGLTPQLELTYNHQGGNGIAGIGWSLNGLSQIQRCSKRRAVDGYIAQVNFGSGDAWCLDGQRLLPIAAQSTEYRTEIDTYSRIVRQGTGFRVWTKSGEIMDYGLDPGTHQSLVYGGPDHPSTVLSARLEKVYDATGNMFSVEYFNPGSVPGQSLVRRIDYGRHKSAPSPVSAAVVFDYENRLGNERFDGYLAGARQGLTQRLVHITNTVGGVQVSRYQLIYEGGIQQSQLQAVERCGSDGACLPVTRFDWTTGSQEPRWSSVVSHPFYPESDGWNDSQYVRATGDFNGDGRTDLIGFGAVESQIIYADFDQGAPEYRLFDVLSRQANVGDPAWEFGQDQRLIGDITGNGTDDIVGVQETGAVWIYTTGRDSTLQAMGHRVTFQPGGTTLLSDVTGDGAMDIVWLKGAVAQVAVSNRNGTFQAPVTWLNWFTGGSLEDLVAGMRRTRLHRVRTLPDVNGDGMGDIVLVYNGIVHVALSTGAMFSSGQSEWLNFQGLDAFGCQLEEGGWGPNLTDQYHFGDVNGDRLADLVIFARHGVHVALSTGTHFLDPDPDGAQATYGWSGAQCPGNFGNGSSNRWSTSFGYSTDGGIWQHSFSARFLADVNGDGRADVVGFGSDGPQVALSNGTNSFIRQYAGASATLVNGFGYGSAGGWWNAVTRMRTLSDVDGDGLADFVGFNVNGVYVARGFQDVQPRISRITTGLGNEIRVVYKPLGDSGTPPQELDWNPGSDRALAGAYPVVSQVYRSDGIGGDESLRYFYLHGRIDSAERGFLGFEQITTVNETRRSLTNTHYRQDFPFVGRVDREIVFLGKGEGEMVTNDGEIVASNTVKVSEASYQYQDNFNSANGVHAVRVTRTEERVYDPINGQHLSSEVLENQNVDAYGNPGTVIQRTTDHANGNQTWTTTTTNTYDNSISSDRWHLGRLRRSSATHTAPNTAGITKVSAFDYNQQNGLLSEEIVEPDRINTSLYEKTSYSYDAYGHKTSVTKTGYNRQGGLLQRRTNSVITFESLNGHPVRKELLTNPRYHTETHYYSLRHGEPLQKIDANGLATVWQYDSFGRKIREDRPDSTSTQITRAWYNCGSCTQPLPRARYSITTTTSGSAAVTAYFDGLGRQISESTKGFGGSTIRQDTYYDARGRVERLTDPYFASGSIYPTFIYYDAADRPWKEIQPGNRITTRSYSGFTVTETNPKNQVTIKLSNAKGQLVSVQEPTGGTTLTHKYDAVGNQSEARVGGNTVVTVYDLRDRKIQMTDPDMGTWVYEYNSFGELEYQRDAKNQTVITQYDSLGRPYRRTEGAGTTTWTYDNCNKGVGKLCSESGPQIGYSRTLTYDAYGREIESRISVTGEASATNSMSYDASGRLRSHTYPSGAQILYNYDAQGDLNQVLRLAGSFDTDNGYASSYRTAAQQLESQAATLRGQIESEKTTVYADIETQGLVEACLDGLSGPQAAIYEAAAQCHETGAADAEAEAAQIKEDNYIFVPIDFGGILTIIPTFRTPEAREAYEAALLEAEESRLLAQKYTAWSVTEWDAWDIDRQVRQLTLSLDLIDRGLGPVNDILWTAQARDARGRVTRYSLGNGLLVDRNYAADTGFLKGIHSRTGGLMAQDLGYAFDKLGNLERRTDYQVAQSEQFSYDNLNRLTQSQVRGVLGRNGDQPILGGQTLETRAQSYDTLGNIVYKTGVGDYDYLPGRPHAVSRAGDVSYSYDANGNLGSDTSGRTITWTSFNKPSLIDDGQMQSAFAYGASHQRVRQISTATVDGTERTTTTFYLGTGYRRVYKPGGDKVEQHDIEVPGASVLYTKVTAGAGNPAGVPAGSISGGVLYALPDHQGSTDVITGADGGGAVLLQRQSFSAFGERRESGDWTQTESDPQGMALHTPRGYTGHEQLDTLNLVHMNGRIYDPRLGRFLSADPFIDGGSSQAYNRYTYVANNPLSYTDPSGYFLNKLMGSLIKPFMNFMGRYGRIIVAVSMAAMSGGLAAELSSYVMVAGGAAGFTGILVATGSFNQALEAGVFGALSADIAHALAHVLKLRGAQLVMAHGVTQGLITDIRGGRFTEGFLGAVVSKAAMGQLPPNLGGAGPIGTSVRTAMAAIIGGTASALSGGKFANGAISGAFVHLFNAEGGRGEQIVDPESEYAILRRKVSLFFKDNRSPSAVMALTADEMNVVYRLVHDRIRADGWNPLDVHQQFSTGWSDTFFYGHASRLFLINGSTYKGGNVNYLYVGMRAEFYAVHSIARNAMVSFWNLGQYIFEGYHFYDIRQANPFGDAAQWASKGAAYFRRNPHLRLK